MAVRSPNRYGQPEAPQVKPRNDAYTGLLAISLGGMLLGCLLLGLDYLQYSDVKPPKVDLPPLPKAGVAPAVIPVPMPKEEEKKPEEKKPEEKKEEKMEKKDDGKDKMEKKDEKKDDKKD